MSIPNKCTLVGPLYIRFSNKKVYKSVDFDSFVLDHAKDLSVIGIEILDQCTLESFNQRFKEVSHEAIS